MSLGDLKVLTVIGTRPEIIRLSRIIPALDRFTDHRIVHTGQNYDYELNEIFFEDLDLRRPDHFLNVDTSSLGAVLGGVLTGIEDVITREQPHALVVLGDTNSSVSALIAKRMKVTVYHLEAGNRCFDDNVPEEINRRVIDHLADFNLTYTEHARRYLLAEGIHPRRVYVMGSPLREVLDYYSTRIRASDAMGRLGVEPQRYLLASIHREENVDNPDHLRELLRGLESVGRRFESQVIVSTHPRTRKRLTALGGALPESDWLRFVDPLGFIDYNCLQLHALCVLSDSGTIAEESAILSFPAVTIRSSMERPEALDTGSLMITGIDAERIEACVAAAIEQRASGQEAEIPVDYQIRNSSQRVLNLILGTAKLNRVWANLSPAGRETDA